MTPKDWIDLVGLVFAALSLLGGLAYVVYRFGRLEASISSKLKMICASLQSIMEGRATTCALHRQELDHHQKQLDTLFHKWDALARFRGGNGESESE